MTWILLYAAYAFIQGAAVVVWFDGYCYTRDYFRVVWRELAHSVAWAALYAPALTALLIVAYLEGLKRMLK